MFTNIYIFTNVVKQTHSNTDLFRIRNIITTIYVLYFEYSIYFCILHALCTLFHVKLSRKRVNIRDL